MNDINNQLIDPLEYVEVFKPVTEDIMPGIEIGRYEVSNFGRMFDKKLNRFCAIATRPDGYKSINMYVNGKSRTYLLHRIVALLFVNGDKSLIVNHIDGDKGHCDFTNLEWCTYSDNNNHAFSHGLNVRGEDSPKAVITEDQARQICQHLDEQKLTYAEIAEACGIDSPDAASLISAIRKGVAWMHVSKDYEFAKHYKDNGIYRPVNRNK